MAKSFSMAKMFVLIVGAIVVSGIALIYVSGLIQPAQVAGSGASTNIFNNQQPQTQSVTSCNATSGSSLVTYTLVNDEDTTQTDTMDSTYLVNKLNADNTETLVSIGTDSTSGTVSVNCPGTYRIRTVHGTGTGGANTRLDSVIVGNGASISPDGKYVQFAVDTASYRLDVYGSRYSPLCFRIKNTDNNNYHTTQLDVDNKTDVCYLTGNVFTSNSNLGQNVTVGTGGSTNFNVEYKVNGTNGTFSDLGYYILVDANTNRWKEPTALVSGVTEILNIKGDTAAGWTSFENIQFSADEYAYRIDTTTTNRVRDSPTRMVAFTLTALDNTNPANTDSPVFRFAPIGGYQSSLAGGTTVLYGAAVNNASYNVLTASQTLTYGVQ